MDFSAFLGIIILAYLSSLVIYDKYRNMPKVSMKHPSRRLYAKKLKTR